MLVSARHRKLISWIAALAVLLAAVAPAASHALASATGTPWVQVCTAQGSKWIPFAEDPTEQAPASAHVLDHCPYCSLQTPALGLPPAPPQLLPLDRRGLELPLAFLSAPRTLHAWVSAQPRAPPLFS
jgi:hypothetical protein